MKALLFSTTGRIPRSSFWLGLLLGFGVTVAATVVVLILLVVPQAIDGGKSTALTLVFAGLSVLIILATVGLLFWSGLCLGIKRYHDHGKSGVWVLIQFVPFIGAIWYFIEAGCLAGTRGPNPYGGDRLRPEMGDAPALVPPSTVTAGRPGWVLPVLLVLALPGAVMCLVAAGMAANTSSWLKAATHVDGTVIGLKPGSTGTDGHATSYAIVEAKTPDGTPFQITDKWATYPQAEIGSKTALVYPDGRPSEAIIDGFTNLWLVAVMLAGFGAAGALFWLLVAALVKVLWKRRPAVRVA